MRMHNWHENNKNIHGWGQIKHQSIRNLNFLLWYKVAVLLPKVEMQSLQELKLLEIHYAKWNYKYILMFQRLMSTVNIDACSHFCSFLSIWLDFCRCLLIFSKYQKAK